jgi:hypothetical protein
MDAKAMVLKRYNCIAVASSFNLTFFSTCHHSVPISGVAHESYRGIVLSAHTRERSIWGVGGGAGGTGAAGAASAYEEVEEEVKPRHPEGELA